MKHSLAEKKVELASIIREVTARLVEVGGNGVVGPVSLDLCWEAAGLAAILGFPCPPLENFAIEQGAGEYDRALAANSNYAYVTGIRCHSPSGGEHGTLYVQAYRQRGVLDKSKLPDGLSRDSRSVHHATIVRILGSWQRAVDGLDTGSVRHSRKNLRQRENSGEAVIFNLSLYREFGETVRSAEDTAAWNRLFAQVKPGFLDEHLDQQSAEFMAKYEPVIQYPSPGKRTSRPSIAETNIQARELLERDPSFRDKTLREWAEALGCSTGLVAKLPVWKAVMEKRNEKSGNHAKCPAVVTLSDKVLSVGKVADDPAVAVETDEIMAKLIADAPTAEGREHLRNLTPEGRRELVEAVSAQQADDEPSPLQDDPPDSPLKPVKTRKRL